jgi:hypothetical protein
MSPIPPCDLGARNTFRLFSPNAGYARRIDGRTQSYPSRTALPRRLGAAVAGRQDVEAMQRDSNKEVPAGVSRAGTKVGVLEDCSLAQNSKVVGSQADSWSNF